MKILNFFQVAPGALRHPVIMIGVFDGVHKGHQKLLALGKEWAQKLNGETVVVTFIPHPQQVLSGHEPPLITSLASRLALFERFAVDTTLLIHFTEEIATIPPEVFVNKYLVGNFQMGGMIAGQNFRFGYKGQGNVALLAKLCEKHPYKIIGVDTDNLPDGTLICSTNIRQAIQNGDMPRAQAMLGRPFSLLGKVIKGEERGRTLGFPTANLQLFHTLVPQEGVYWGFSMVSWQICPALISIGTSPTFGEKNPLKVEVHLLNFSGNLYGKTIETYVIDRIRNQQNFKNKQALCEQMAKDRAYLLKSWEPWLMKFRQSPETAFYW
jgi:riboflavin kinase/FMN adenylyltransferase